MSELHFPYQYICIEGNIGTGKTSFSRLMKKEYDCRLILEEFSENPFLPYFYEDPERFAFTVELFFMTERYKQMERNLISQRDLFSPFTLSDYTFVKTLIFARKNLKSEEYRLFQQLFQTLQNNFPNPDLLVYLHRNVDILLQNIKKRGREYEVYITREYLYNIQDSYFDYFRNIVSFPVLIIDIDDLDFLSEKKYYDVIKSLIAKKYNPGVHRVSLHV
ncbi:MAG TPA: deoxynucleoside kinase [Saprospirales bacterium]|jgi:deoxyguanosine kinase|nr:deoxynucleoside kinase [Saprospirales bacterium]